MRKSLTDKTFLNAIVSYPLTSNGGLLGNMADSSLSSFSSIFFFNSGQGLEAITPDKDPFRVFYWLFSIRAQSTISNVINFQSLRSSEFCLS